MEWAISQGRPFQQRVEAVQRGACLEVLQERHGGDQLRVCGSAVEFVQLGDEAAGVALASSQQVGHRGSHLCIPYRGMGAQKKPMTRFTQSRFRFFSKWKKLSCRHHNVHKALCCFA